MNSIVFLVLCVVVIGASSILLSAALGITVPYAMAIGSLSVGAITAITKNWPHSKD